MKDEEEEEEVDEWDEKEEEQYMEEEEMHDEQKPQLGSKVQDRRQQLPPAGTAQMKKTEKRPLYGQKGVGAKDAKQEETEAVGLDISKDDELDVEDEEGEEEVKLIDIQEYERKMELKI